MLARLTVVLSLFISISFCSSFAQSLGEDAGIVPPLVRYSGTLHSSEGGMVGVTFALYKDQHGGAPLWLETQNVQADETGKFTVMLGANHAGGVPTDLFAAGEARWLGVQPEGQAEQERVLLVSVPYALKASDAETLGGKPLSAFVLADNGSPAISAMATRTQGLNLIGSATDPIPVTVLTPLQNYLPKFSDGAALVSSRLYETGGNVGIGTTAPESILDIAANSSQNVRIGTTPWSLRFGSLQSGTQFIGIAVKKKAADNNYIASSQNIATVNHTVMEFHYDGSVRIKQQAHQTDGTILTPTTSFSVATNGNVGVGVDKATQKLEVSGNVKITGTGNGLVFADGTILNTATPAPPGLTGVTAGAGLTGGGTTGSPTLSLDTTFADARYLRAGTNFIGGITAGTGLTGGGVSGTPTLALDTAYADGRYLRIGGNYLSGVTAGAGLTGGGSTGSPTVALDTNFADARYMRVGANVLAGVTAGQGLTGGGTTGTPTLALDTAFADARYMRVGTAGAITAVTAGAGLTGGGSTGSLSLGLDTAFTDSRYVKATASNVFNGDQTIKGGLAVQGALASGGQVVTGNVVASGNVSAATISGTGVTATTVSTDSLQAHVPAEAAGGVGITVLADNDTATGLDITASTTTGTATGLHSTVNSPYGFAGIFDNIAGGSILLGRIKVGEYWVKKFRVDGNGRVYANNGYSTGGADFAESFAVAGAKIDYEPGDVLVIDTESTRRLSRSAQPYSTLVAGVYSTRPGVLASPYDMDDPNLEKEVPLAVVGVVPCKVTAENGPIHAGDLLVSSSLPGHAMKGTDRSRMLGAIVGKALQPLSAGAGTIEILVTLQ